MKGSTQMAQWNHWLVEATEKVEWGFKEKTFVEAENNQGDQERALEKWWEIQ